MMRVLQVVCVLTMVCVAFSNRALDVNCPPECSCLVETPWCPPGVSLMPDACMCCQVCAGQLGDLCSARQPCDLHKNLRCGDSGLCEAQGGASCYIGDVMYRSGESFQPNCKYQCTCLDGTVGCQLLCSEDVRLPSRACPFPKRVKVPGKCCEEWQCEDRKETALGGHALAAFRQEMTYGPRPQQLRGNCIVQTTDWSACSATCGMGVSTRVSNDNEECRLEQQARLCTVRPCGQQLHNSIKMGKKCLRTRRSEERIHLRYSGCISKRTFRPKYCGSCTDGRCCTPYHTRTMPVAFKCPNGERVTKAVMMIKSCVCHRHCPEDNSLFSQAYGRNMLNDMA
uniref:CCN family member 3 n=1 Tax=Eptatretus burgeri TaxID=7764 RepID=A0A8C4QN60_EPTBU